METQKVLFVLTSHDQLGDTERKTGFHFQEMSEPYYILEDNGFEVSLASIQGEEAPADPGSLADRMEDNEASVQRFHHDPQAMEKLQNTAAIENMDIEEFAGIYLPGGHGTMWDFPDNRALISAIETAWMNNMIVSAICHGPSGLINCTDSSGQPIVQDHRLNSFTDAEEREVGLDQVVPFMLENKLREKGAIFENASAFEPKVVEAGRLITGQNPASAKPLANVIVRKLKEAQTEAA